MKGIKLFGFIILITVFISGTGLPYKGRGWAMPTDPITISGHLDIPACNYCVTENYTYRVRVEGTTLESPQFALDQPFILYNAPVGQVTLLVDEFDPYGNPAEEFQNNSRRKVVNVPAGGLSNVTFNLMRKWAPMKLPAIGASTKAFFEPGGTGWMLVDATVSSVQKRRLLRTPDLGQTWTEVHAWNIKDDTRPTYLFFLDSTYGWASTESSAAILYTRDGGATWSNGTVQCPYGPGKCDSIYVNLFSASNANLAYAGGCESGVPSLTPGVLWETKDGGANWSIQRQSLEYSCGAISGLGAAPDGTAVAFNCDWSSPDPDYLFTRDTQGKWTTHFPISMSVNSGLGGVYIPYAGGTYFTTSPVDIFGSSIYTSTDGGVSWQPLWSNPPGYMSFLTTKKGWAGGSSILITRDGGLTWRNELPTQNLVGVTCCHALDVFAIDEQTAVWRISNDATPLMLRSDPPVADLEVVQHLQRSLDVNQKPIDVIPMLSLEMANRGNLAAQVTSIVVHGGAASRLAEAANIDVVAYWDIDRDGIMDITDQLLGKINYPGPSGSAEIQFTTALTVEEGVSEYVGLQLTNANSVVGVLGLTVNPASDVVFTSGGGSHHATAPASHTLTSYQVQAASPGFLDQFNNINNWQVSGGDDWKLASDTYISPGFSLRTDGETLGDKVITTTDSISVTKDSQLFFWIRYKIGDERQTINEVDVEVLDKNGDWIVVREFDGAYAEDEYEEVIQSVWIAEMLDIHVGERQSYIPLGKTTRLRFTFTNSYGMSGLYLYLDDVQIVEPGAIQFDLFLPFAIRRANP